MEATENSATRLGLGRLGFALLFCLVGLGINLIGSQLTTFFQLPIYLDSLGTVLVAFVGGYVPGILVGYLTNLAGSVGDNTMLYYGVVNVLIAVVAAFFAHRGWAQKPLGAIGLVISLALIGGALGSVLTWYLFAFDFGNVVSTPFAQQIYELGIFNVFGSQLVADFAIDVVDKAIVVVLAIVIVRFLPKDFIEQFDFSLWMQTPLSAQEKKALRSTEIRKTSLRTKVAALVSIIMIIITIVTASICFAMYHNANIEVQAETGKGITNLMANLVDGDKVDEYLEKGQDADGYMEVKRDLYVIMDAFADVEYVYAYKILPDGCHVVFDLDTSEIAGAAPGSVVEFDESFSEYLPSLLAGETIDPIISNDTYGWLLTIYQPVYDDSGECACYVATDISMGDLVTKELGFVARIISLFAGFFIAICAVVLWLADYGVIFPVNATANATSRFAFRTKSTLSEAVDRLRKLDVNTGDELENLFRAIVKMSEDTERFIADSQEKSATIDRMQSNLIMVMADLVESRDKFTGDHIRNTAAYVELILEEMKKEGIYADQMTDEFISNTIRSAPLHDIGKIVVSDNILNKPGRLTEEEFEIMKSHTIAGRDIIQSAVGAVSESSYLDEAQNLAAYHHEKWNGRGYPCGLAGEDIPLSARVMAVADVFDALVSKRSYKDGFPIEKALDIIREGVGSHFDPSVAEAFLNAEAEVRLIAEKNVAKQAAELERARALAENAG